MTDGAPYEKAIAYCREHAAPPGSTPHYCTVFLEPRLQATTLALYAFAAELAELAEKCTDAETARTRIAWWERELAVGADGEPRHPVARALAHSAAPDLQVQHGLLPMLDALRLVLGAEGEAMEDEVRARCRVLGGIPARLIARAAGADEEATLEAASQVGALLCAHDMFVSLYRRPRYARLGVARERLDANGVTRRGLYDTPGDARVQAFVRDHALHIAEALRSALAGAGTPPATPAPERARALIALANLKSVARGGTARLMHHPTVSPLRKLWIAWRAIG